MRKGMRKRMVGIGALVSAIVMLTAAGQPLLSVTGGGQSLYRTGDGTSRALKTGSDEEPWNKTFYTADTRLEADPAMEAGVAQTVPEGMDLFCRDGDLELYLDEKTTAFAVRDTRSGCVWSSTPADKDLDKVAMGDNLKRLSALIMIEYYTADGAVQTFDSYNHSVAFGNFAVEKQANGFTAVYQIGRQQTVTSNDVPP